MLSIAIVAVFAAIGGLLTGNALGEWFAQIKQPEFALSITGWYIVGILYYTMAIAILYQLFVANNGPQKRTAIGLAFAMLAGNEFWNYLFFGLESTLLGFVGLIPFTILVIVLLIKLWKFQQQTAWVLLPYVLWLGYDLAWAYQLWRLNG